MGEVVAQLLEVGPTSLHAAVEVTETVAVSGLFYEGWDDTPKVILAI